MERICTEKEIMVRNRWLETLIARRQANNIFIDEKNLIIKADGKNLTVLLTIALSLISLNAQYTRLKITSRD